MIDNRYQVETAEGIDITIEPASLAVRTYAFALDFLIRIVIVLSASFVFGMMAEFGFGLLLITMFLVEWFYPVVFEITKQATPGKKAFNLKVVYENGLPITFAGSLTRNLFRFIDFLPFCYATGAISMLLNKQNKRLGDMVAGTTVIYQNPRATSPSFEYEMHQFSLPNMSTEQQKMIISFAQRSSQLSEARQIELANILEPVLGLTGVEAVKRIQSIAAILIGKSKVDKS
ncbi:RDD family protein [Ningiella sp. W23]|uniref:RDD family protein n=1 Tax=Ningiella sp. W23 TaxID=3023715 RepID=UPI0037567792